MFIVENYLRLGHMTTKQAKFVKAKLEGKSNTQAALAAVPNIKPSYAPVAGHRLMHNDNVQEALQKALQKHNITIDRTAQVVAEALDAEKQNQYTGEIITDHTVRLKAADMAHGLMGLKGQKQDLGSSDRVDPGTAKELAEAIRSGDEVRVTQAVWNTKDGS